MATTKQTRPAEVGATGVGGGVAVVMLALLNYIGWERSAEIDAAIVAIVAALAGPLWARFKAWAGLSDELPKAQGGDRPKAGV